MPSEKITSNAVLARVVSRPALITIAAVAVLTLSFEAWRGILFILMDRSHEAVPAVVWVRAFLVGLRFDFAVACYVSIPIYLVVFVLTMIHPSGKGAAAAAVALLALTAAVTFFIHLADIEFFKFFNTRLNGMALQWIDTPGFMVSMIWQSYPVVKYMLLYAGMLGLFFWVARTVVRRITGWGRPGSRWVDLVWLPATLVILLIGARGRVEEKAPLTWGLAYFSSYDAANQLALNPTFTFLRDAIYDRGSQRETREVMERIASPNAPALVRELLGLPTPDSGSETCRLSRTGKGTGTAASPPNVLVIIMESFGSSHIGCLDSLVPYRLTPHFDSIAGEGILFTNIYSAGSHTYAGIMGTLYGYPTIYGKSIMKQVAGQSRFLGLPNLLRDRGYETLFFTTHDPHFDNMQGFLMANGIQRVISLFDFDEAEKLSTLGVADHVMFDRALADLGALGERPWFAALLTATNHGPWIVPDVPFGALPDTVSDQARLNAFKYSDWALGRFLRQLQADPAFHNTLVVVTADNGMLYRPQVDLDPTQFRIPLLFLWIDGEGGNESRRIDRLGSQVDLVATVMGQLPYEYDNMTFGRDLLGETEAEPAWAQFSDWDKIGFVMDGQYCITRLDGPTSLYRLTGPDHRLRIDTEPTSDSPEEMASLRDHGLAIFTEAYFNIFRPNGP